MADSRNGRGAPLPGARPLPVYPVWWARVGDADLDLTSLEETWEGYYVHWCPPEPERPKGGDRLCLEAGEGCPYHAFALKWVAYLPVWNHAKRERGGVVLTPRAARDLQEIGATPGGLYGLRLRIWHTGAGAAGGVRAALSGEPRLYREPERISLQETLRVLWRLPRTPNELLAPLQKGDLIPFPDANANDRYGLGGARGGVR